MVEKLKRLEEELNHFDPETRYGAFDALMTQVRERSIALPNQGPFFNMHCHSFFSYNGYGYSPLGLAWRGRVEGLYAMGLVDFDVLDGVEEFLGACPALGLRACAGFETRIFVPEFADREINSPGEPGISYHMGAGMVSAAPGNDALIHELKTIAQRRNRGMTDRINAYLNEVALDYDVEVLPLTPKGNATERHVCMAYDRKAQTVFPGEAGRVAYWSGKLRAAPETVRAAMENPPVFQGMIRAKLMKAGGVGYVAPEGPDFPQLGTVNQFILSQGGIPVFAWLDGTTSGEQCIEELLDVMTAAGTAAVNIIPDRNWNIADPETRRLKVAHLHSFVALARDRGLPILAGTEMNAYGQRFVDDFEAPEMRDLYQDFLDGVHLFHGHTLLQAHAGIGYLSDWAEAHFGNVHEKNRFYVAVGHRIASSRESAFLALQRTATPQEIEHALGL